MAAVVFGGELVCFLVVVCLAVVFTGAVVSFDGDDEVLSGRGYPLPLLMKYKFCFSAESLWAYMMPMHMREIPPAAKRVAKTRMTISHGDLLTGSILKIARR